MQRVEVLIIGGGPAGLAAAIGAYEAGCRDILVLEREEKLGGILKQCIHNGFGLKTFDEELTGPEYAARYIDKVLRLGIPCRCGTTVLSVTADKTVTAVSAGNGLEAFSAGAVILATGCRERPRGSLATPGERCAGIYTAGTAQKLTNLKGLMPGKEVVILGSGDIGLIMARRMTLLGARVHACVELMPYSSGLKRNIVQCLDDFGIPLLLGHTVVDIHGRERLTGITVAAVDEARQPIPGTEREIPCDTLLLSVGLLPENELASMAGIPLTPSTGGPAVDEGLETAVAGIFSCGNALHVHDLVDFVSEEAMRAGESAYRYVQNTEKTAARKLPVVPEYGVGGTVPQLVSAEAAGEIRFMFRPKNVYKNAFVVITAGEKEVFRKRYLILTPGEMVCISLAAEKLTGDSSTEAIRIRIEVSEA